MANRTSRSSFLAFSERLVDAGAYGSPEEIAVVVRLESILPALRWVFRGCGKLAIRLPARLNETRFTLTRICTSDTRRCPIGRGKASLHGCPLNS